MILSTSRYPAISCSSRFSRRGFLLDELPDSGTRGDDALDGIRCLGALYLGNFHEFFEFLRALLQIQFLLAAFRIWLAAGRPQAGAAPFLPLAGFWGIEGFPSLTFFPFTILKI